MSDPTRPEPRPRDRRSRRPSRRHSPSAPFGGAGPFDPHGPFFPRGHWDTRRGRPKWWPQDEAWPPTSDFPWRKVRRSFFVRFAVGVALVFTLVVVGPIVLIGQLLSVAGLRTPVSEIVSVVIVVGLLAALSGTARGARRFAVPFGDRDRFR